MNVTSEIKGPPIRPSLLGLVMAQMVCAPFALAEEATSGASGAGGETHQLKAVTVTAEKVAGTEQDTPVAMTVVTGEDLDASSAKDTIDVVRQVPNMFMTKAGQHASVAFASIRGVTPLMETEQPVGFFVDGVYQRNIDMELMDIDRIEVLRGPQSTLYGRNTEAGAVNIVTRDPEPHDEQQISLGYGNYNRKTLSALSGGALGNRDWSYRAAIQVFDSDGYFTQVPTGSETADDANDINARLKLRWNPGQRWDVMATYDGARYREGSTNIASFEQIRSDPHKVMSNYAGSNKTDNHTGNIRTIYNADSFTVTSISAAGSEAKKTTYDVDATIADSMRLRTEVDYTRFTQELRISSPDHAEGPRWVGGLYYFDQTDHNTVDMNMSGMGFGTQVIKTTTDTRNLAAFGQATWPVLDQLAVITGLRYDIEYKDVDNHQVWGAIGRDYTDSKNLVAHAWLPKVGLEYKPIEGLMAFATYSEGYKAGGYNNLSNELGKEVYRPEYTTNYEIGFKHTGLDNTLQTKVSLFWIDWRDQQVEENVLTQSSISNAAKSVSRGVELEVAWQATRRMLLKAGGGWNDAHFVNYYDGSTNYSGNRPPNAPAYTYSLGGDYRFDSGLYAHADWLGTGEIYYDSANQQKGKPYGLLNMKTGYQFDSYEVALWIKNALDEVYVTRAFNLGSAAAPAYGGIAGDPRTFGLTLTARW